MKDEICEFVTLDTGLSKMCIENMMSELGSRRNE
jgi:hypothetical protein